MKNLLVAVRLAAPPLTVFILFLVLWYAVANTIYAGQSYLFPGPTEVARTMLDQWRPILDATAITFRTAALGYVLAIAIGMTSAAVLSQSKILERSFYPYAVLLQTVPVVAVAPLIVLWFGYDERSVVIISLIISLFPIINNTLLGLVSTSKNLVDLFRLHKVNRFVRFWKLQLPAAAPNIVAGLRISAGLSVIGAIVGEFIIGSGNSQGGLGVQIIFAQGRMDTPRLFAQVIAATGLGFSFFAIVSYVGNLFLKNWHESSSRVENG